MYNLHKSYRSGEGVARDPVCAREWLRNAADMAGARNVCPAPRHAVMRRGQGESLVPPHTR